MFSVPTLSLTYLPSSASVGGISPSESRNHASRASESLTGLTPLSTASNVLRDGALQIPRFLFSLGNPSSSFCSGVRLCAKRTNSDTFDLPQSIASTITQSTVACGMWRLTLRLSGRPISAPNRDSTPPSLNGSSLDGLRTAASASGSAVPHIDSRQLSRRGFTHRTFGLSLGT